MGIERRLEFTPSRDGDSPILPELPDQIPESEDIGTVTADGACDTRRCHTAIIEWQATAIMPDADIDMAVGALMGNPPHG